MQKLIGLFLFAFLLLTSLEVNAQLTKEQINERKEFVKSSKEELTKKTTRIARREAKRLRKEGWKIAPGALPLEKQLDKVYMMQYEYDENLFPKYIIAEAMTVGENYDAAKMQANELAKQNLAGQIQTEIAALIETSLANKQLSSEEAASIAETMIAGKSLISQRIGRVVIVVEAYRTLKNKNKEVLVRVAYNSDMAKETAKQVIRENLEDKNEGLHMKLEKLLGM